MSKFVEVKTAELTGPALDWAVAKATWGGDINSEFNQLFLKSFHPSTDWVQGGKLIDEHGVEFKWLTDAAIEAYSYTLSENTAMGGSHLEAMCRLLAMELGDMVQIPSELFIQ